VVQTNQPEFIPAIAGLYTEAYTQGISAQYIDSEELKTYLIEILKTGTAILQFENNILTACLLYTPLSFDKLCPEKIKSEFEPDKCLYIAEVMVSLSYRGMGLGKKLLTEFFKNADTVNYNHVFLRVWENNLPALTLYSKSGFERVTTIDQLKKMPDGKTDFVMKKIYLHKPFNQESDERI